MASSVLLSAESGTKAVVKALLFVTFGGFLALWQKHPSVRVYLELMFYWTAPFKRYVRG